MITFTVENQAIAFYNIWYTYRSEPHGTPYLFEIRISLDEADLIGVYERFAGVPLSHPDFAPKLLDYTDSSFNPVQWAIDSCATNQPNAQTNAEWVFNNITDIKLYEDYILIRGNCGRFIENFDVIIAQQRQTNQILPYKMQVLLKFKRHTAKSIIVSDPRLSRLYSPTLNLGGFGDDTLHHQLLLLDGEPFTGYLYDVAPDDATKILWKKTYKFGIGHGLEVAWYNNGFPKYAYDCVELGRERVFNGMYAEWYPNGQLKKEVDYYEGVMVAETLRCFDESGIQLPLSLEKTDFSHKEAMSARAACINWSKLPNADETTSLYNQFRYDDPCPCIYASPTKTQQQILNYIDRPNIEWRYSPRSGSFLAIVKNEPFSGVECAYYDNSNTSQLRWSQEYFWGEAWGEYKEWAKDGNLRRIGTRYFNEWHGELLTLRNNGEIEARFEYYLGFKWAETTYYANGAAAQHVKIVPISDTSGNKITTTWDKDGALLHEIVEPIGIAAPLHQRAYPIYNFARELNTDGTFSHLLKHKF